MKETLYSDAALKSQKLLTFYVVLKIIYSWGEDKKKLNYDGYQEKKRLFSWLTRMNMSLSLNNLFLYLFNIIC